ncbi:MAG: VapC toxin family PIN domain ribonuclease [Dehalococcoidia bacterium]|nr:VapC toxin family PIN domain ribonuclease [Dehalococcoidia bacterium]
MSSPPTGARRVFLDSSGFLALIHPHDAYHQEARTCWTWLTDHHWMTATTNFILAETHALFLARLGPAHATAFVRELPHSTARIERVTVADEQRAVAIIWQYTDKGFSLTDATSFAVMERLGITHALAYDRHFTQYGLTVLTPDVHSSWAP